MLHNTGIEAGSTWNKFNRPHIHILILILIALVCYSNTFHVPFILDDEGSIQLHTPVHGLANYFAEGWPGYNYLPNRAFGYLTLALNYEFHELNLPGYHLVNLVIHIIASLLVYAFTRLLFRTPVMAETNDSPHVRMFAFVVALLFVSHPIQTQAVTYIVQRFTSLTTMLYLAALVCYLRWRLLQTDVAPQSGSKGLGWYALAIISTVLAMKTKEISFTLPIMILLFECSFFGMPKLKLFARLVPLLATLAIIPTTTFLKFDPIIKSVGGGIGSYLSDTQSNTFGIIKLSRWEYLYTQFSVISTYLRLLFFPVNQHLDYDYPINHSLMDPRALISLILLLTIVATAAYMYAKSATNTPLANPGNRLFTTPSLLRLAAFGIFWFFITLSVESSIISIRDVIYEHRLYLPSFGFFLAITALTTLGVNQVANNSIRVRQITFAVVFAIMVILSSATYNRNAVWRDWITLWSDNVAKTPAKPRPHNILGIGYFYKGDFDNAMRKYQEAVRLKPDFIEVYYNMGLVLTAGKNHKEAIAMFIKVLNLSAFNVTQYAKTYNELGINNAELGNYDQAVTDFAAAVKYQPESVEYINNYAFALATTGNVAEATRQYQKVLQLDPSNLYAIKALDELPRQNSRTGQKHLPYRVDASK